MLNKLVLIMVISALAMGSAQAISLGDIKVYSHLSQPLHAEVEIPSIKPTDEVSMDIGLGSHDLYARSGWERPPVLDKFIATLKWREDGSAYILLRTNGPMNELAVSFFLEISWDGGRVLRQYDILLEPMGMQGAVKHSLESETIVTVEPETSGATTEKGTTISSLRPARASMTAQVSGSGQISYGPVRPGESLSRIAQRMRQDRSLSLEQMMLAIYRENSHAFLLNDMNNLSAGVMLHLNKPNLIGRTSRQEAKNLVAAHAAGWGGAPQQLAGVNNSNMAPTSGSMDKPLMDPAAGRIQRGGSAGSGRLVLSEPLEIDAGLEVLPEVESVDVAQLSKIEQQAHVSKIAQQIDQTRAAARAVEQRNQALRERLQLLQGQIAKLQTNLKVIDKQEDRLNSQLAGKAINEQQMVKLLAPESHDDSLVLDDFMPLPVSSAAASDVILENNGDQPVFIAEPSKVASAPLIVSSPVASSSILATPPKSISRNAPQFLDESMPGNSSSGILTALSGVSILSLAVLGFVVRYRRDQLDHWLEQFKLRFGKNKTNLPF